ncbi:MAG TPA: GNAT family N-acetyltransferase [Thermoanaerobaculia bacterium]|jgi:GNAT superfamily N-acetyltransferase|nr:GNAT family N-acetyltransferase [Thermoanaerobaculia bacterium]
MNMIAASPGVIWKRLTEPWELDQVYLLKHRVFAEEIPQHPESPDRRLVDARLAMSVPFVALAEGRVIGMVAISYQRPFSLDEKLPDLDSYLPPHERACEVRLLSVEPEWRRGPVFAGLLGCVIEQGRSEGCDLAVISGIERQAKLYRHLGFQTFGPPIGTADAPYRAMYVTWDALAPAARRLAEGAP